MERRHVTCFLKKKKGKPKPRSYHDKKYQIPLAMGLRATSKTIDDLKRRLGITDAPVTSGDSAPSLTPSEAIASTGAPI